MNKKAFKLALFLLVSSFVVTCGLATAQTVKIRIFATSDIHNNYLNYDYFTDSATEQYGLVKVASVVKAERASNPNVLFFDNGDNIQGNPLGEWLAKNPPKNGETGVIAKLMNQAGYDAMTLGNHEFNYGLDYLQKTLAGMTFPVVSANVLKAGTKTPYFKPYAILERSFKDEKGTSRTIKVGVVGFAPPQITMWDAANLKGKAETGDIYEAAAAYIPEMKKAGADVVVCLAHTGISDFPRKGQEENAGYYLTTVSGVDVIVTGHAHMKFPSKAFAKTKGADMDNGTINGIPVVMPGSFADNLGVVDLTMEMKGGKWTRTGAKAALLPVWDSAKKAPLMGTDKDLVGLLSKTHESVLAYIRSPIGGDEGGSGPASTGRLTQPLTSYFALVKDDYSVQIINEAQTMYAENALKGTAYAKLPILSAAAPFKCGGRQGPKYYTNIPAGPLAIKNVADLYVYSNTIVVVKVKGSDVKEWLEMSAGQFNRIDPASKEEQYLVNDKFPTYNFDVIDGVEYEIDVTKPAKYNEDGTVKDAAAERIRGLKFKGRPIDPNQEFLVATNNYRANGGGNFPNVNPSKIVFASPDENRQAILKYIDAKKAITPKTDDNWRIASFKAAGTVYFLTSPLAKDSLPPGITSLGTVETGYGKYGIKP